MKYECFQIKLSKYETTFLIRTFTPFSTQIKLLFAYSHSYTRVGIEKSAWRTSENLNKHQIFWGMGG